MENSQVQMQKNSHVAWISKKNGAAFFNPANIWKAETPGQELNDHIVVAIGSIEQMQAVVDSINATIEPIGNLLEDLN